MSAGVVTGTVTAVGAGQASESSLVWEECGDGFECSTLGVPVDSTAPDGEQVTLALIRSPAADQDRRIGSLIVNYGGPGDPGTETIRDALDTMPQAIRERFDVVTFDPRGTGSSRPIDCVDDETFERLWSEDLTPDGPADLPSYYDGSYSSVDFVQECIRTQGQWLAQVGSREVARDVDRIRAALGEAKISYLGYSYGTVIGALYAELFPDRIRAMVLDSAVNLSTTASEDQLGNVAGFEQALDEFLADCAGDATCAFHSDGDPRAALVALRDRFESGLTLRSDDGRRAGVAEFYTTLLAALYGKDNWPILAESLDLAANDDDGTNLRLVTDFFTGKREDGTYNNFQEAIGVINCADRFTPRASFEEYRATHERLTREYPFFGPVIAAQPVGCDERIPRPAAGGEVGDVRATQAPPILVIGTTDDPATPYEGSRDLRRRLRGSRLLTFVSTEHGSYGKGIACIDDAVDRYLLTRKLPARGTRCSS